MIHGKSIETLKKKYPNIPNATIGAIQRYVEKRIPTGDFLYNVLTNNLSGAIKHADSANERALIDIVKFCYWEIPIICWGTPKKVKTWLEGED